MGSQSSLFRRLMVGFSGVVVAVFLAGLAYVLHDAKSTQRVRTAAENAAHAREVLLHLAALASTPERIRPAAEELERVRVQMFRALDYHSRVRLRVWRHGALLYDSLPHLPDALPAFGSAAAEHANAWVRAVERDHGAGIVVERSHEVDDEWMLSAYGISFLASSTVFSLPLLLVPAWFIVRLGLRPLRSIAAVIEQRSDADLTALPDSKYRELSPLVGAINRLMERLSQRIKREHEFLQDAAHELKTPLAAIQLNAHLLVSRAGGVDERGMEAVTGLRESVARATHMVHQLLALERARTEAADDAPPSLDVAALVRDRLAAAVPLAMQRGIDIELQADGDCQRPMHLESLAALVDNLVSNAIKYSPDDGRIGVTLLPAGGGLRLTVTDQGPGIAPPLRDKVFERFYRIPGQEQNGSGLGLAIAERAAERNGGTIALDEGPDGRGLMVTVQFDR